MGSALESRGCVSVCARMGVSVCVRERVGLEFKYTRQYCNIVAIYCNIVVQFDRQKPPPPPGGVFFFLFFLFKGPGLRGFTRKFGARGVSGEPPKKKPPRGGGGEGSCDQSIYTHRCVYKSFNKEKARKYQNISVYTHITHTRVCRHLYFGIFLCAAFYRNNLESVQ